MGIVVLLMIYWIFCMGIGAVLALIPANIAKKKGRSFGLWWLYGFFLFLIALIHAIVMSEKKSAPISASRSQRICLSCGCAVNENATFCGNCGSPVHVQPNVCPVCGNTVQAGQYFCGVCGNKVQ